MGVSKNNGTPKSSILIGFSIINHPFGKHPYIFALKRKLYQLIGRFTPEFSFIMYFFSLWILFDPPLSFHCFHYQPTDLQTNPPVVLDDHPTTVVTGQQQRVMKFTTNKKTKRHFCLHGLHSQDFS